MHVPRHNRMQYHVGVGSLENISQTDTSLRALAVSSEDISEPVLPCPSHGMIAGRQYLGVPHWTTLQVIYCWCKTVCRGRKICKIIKFGMRRSVQLQGATASRTVI